MVRWYCNVGGQQYGPAEENELRDWIAQGRIGPTDLVWAEGMAQWAQAAAAMPDLFPGVQAGPPPQSMVRVAPPPGTGGRATNDELTAQARGSLSGRWGLAIGFSLLMALIQGGINAVPHAGPLVLLILGGPLQLGLVIFYLTYTRRGNADLGMLFAGFSNFGNALGAHLLMTLFVLLWTLLLIVPGIIAALAYSQTMCLLAEDRTLGPLTAIRRSKEMMDGHKWRLFCLYLRFYLWAILCIFTCGIGLLWLWPYISVACARFYDDLRPATGSSALGGPAV